MDRSQVSGETHIHRSDTKALQLKVTAVHPLKASTNNLDATVRIITRTDHLNSYCNLTSVQQLPQARW